MPKYEHSGGLYRKTESPVTESVRHTEGLYKSVKVAEVKVVNPTEEEAITMKAIESEHTPDRKVLKG